MINEQLARRAKENMSFSDYKPGSATAEYNATIQAAKEKIEVAKAKVSPEAQARLDRLLERYTVNYATWTNKYNSNGAGHVSVMISGPSNYNMRAHNKYLNREGKLWEEYKNIQDIDSKISAIVAGDRIIKSDDVNAIEKLKEKLAKLEESQELMKATNAIIRKKKLTDTEKIEQITKLGISEATAAKLLLPSHCCAYGFASYELTNNNATIRSTKQRIEHLEKLAEQAATTTIEEQTTEINGTQIIDNLEAQRVQIIFPGKPDADTRTELKRNGFKWAPSQGAWQNYRNERSLRTAKEIVSKLAQ